MNRTLIKTTTTTTTTLKKAMLIIMKFTTSTTITMHKYTVAICTCMVIHYSNTNYIIVSNT